MLKASYQKYQLHFREPSGTSRGVLTDKETWLIRIWDEDHPEIVGTGECALFRGLSADDCPDYERMLEWVCRNINTVQTEELQSWSSLRFGLEMAMADLCHGGKGIYFPSDFTSGKQVIEINGLIWMGDHETMFRRIQQKIEAGFHCIKLKIGAIDFKTELSLLRTIRERFDAREVELRVDANGAFSVGEVLSCLDSLSRYDLHSIEQPIRQGQWEEMSRLCASTPVPIALDEELIGVNDRLSKEMLLSAIHPQYVILKPALCGGFSGAEEWIELARSMRIGWWVTSALESNVGLSALAQWTALLRNPMPQGLGTGQLYTNNFPSSLEQRGSVLKMKLK